MPVASRRSLLAAAGSGLFLPLAAMAAQRLQKGLSVEEFGAQGDGATEDYASLQAAIDHAQERGAGLVSLTPGKTYRLRQGLRIDLNKIMIAGNGAKLDFSAMVKGDCITVMQSQTDVNVRALANGRGGIFNLELLGPGVTVTGVRALVLSDTARSLSLANNMFAQIAFRNFANDVTFGDGAFCNTFLKCTFTQTLGSRAPRYSVVSEPGANMGERNEFISCFWFNRDRQFRVRASTIMLSHCSLDYAQRGITVEDSGFVLLSHCHLEFGGDSDHWLYVTGPNSITKAIIRDSLLVLADKRIVHSPFYCDSTVTHGGIEFDGLIVSTIHEQRVPLVGGAGRVVTGSLTLGDFTPRFPIANSVNILAQGSFEEPDALAVDGWSVTDATLVQRSTRLFRTGGASLEIKVNGGAGQEARLTTDAAPGNLFSGELYFRTENLGTSGGTARVEVAWLSAGMRLLSKNILLNEQTEKSDWTRLGLHLNRPAPPGARHLQLTIGMRGLFAKSPILYVDDVMINIV